MILVLDLCLIFRGLALRPSVRSHIYWTTQLKQFPTKFDADKLGEITWDAVGKHFPWSEYEFEEYSPGNVLSDIESVIVCCGNTGELSLMSTMCTVNLMIWKNWPGWTMMLSGMGHVAWCAQIASRSITCDVSMMPSRSTTKKSLNPGLVPRLSWRLKRRRSKSELPYFRSSLASEIMFAITVWVGNSSWML